MASILLIEDSKNIQQKIKQILQFNNHETSYTNNEITALKLIKNNLYDLVIMSDMVMHRMSKYEFIKELKKDDLTACIPVIFLSTKAGYHDFREGMLMGADDYIVRPFKASDLVNSIEIQLQKKERIDSKFNSLRLNIILNLPHQLRTPLMAILGYSSLVIEESEKVGHLEIYEMTKSIQFGAQRLLKHIEKFLNYSSLRTSKNYNNEIKEHRESVINYSAEIIKESCFNKIKCIDRMPYTKFDLVDGGIQISKSHFQIAVGELFENACLYSTKNSEINIKSIFQDDKFVFTISNSGIGISQRQIKNILSFSNNGKPISESKGVGLGLSIVKDIVSIYGGRLLIESIQNKMTQITMILPKAHKHESFPDTKYLREKNIKNNFTYN